MNPQLLERIKRAPQLPSLPSVAMKVLELARRQHASLSEVANVISGDPALAAKVLKTVNSSFYSLPNEVKTINHALSMLGLRTVKTLALGFSLAGSLNADRSKGFDYTRLWRQSLYSAVAARTLATKLQTGEHEEAFLAGLLSDIGTLAMHRALGREYDAILEACEGDQIELVRLSREKFDLDHAQVGGMLAEHWKFPAALVEPIRQHHELSAQAAHGASTSLTVIVHAGVLCGQVFASNRPGLIEKARRELTDRFQFDGPAIQAIFSEIEIKAEELGKLLEVGIPAGRTLMEIEEEARQALMELTLAAQDHSRQVEQQNQQLTELATTDGLTGLANRKRFDHFLATAFAEAAGAASPLSLLFVDIDRFKSINDACSHQAGDRVLAILGQLIKGLVGSAHLAARYGGDELAVVLCRVDLPTAAALAETIRSAIAAQKIAFGEKPISVTVSIGVATTLGRAPCESPADLIAAADRAVYAAKAAGRNCVRSATPPAQRGAA